MSQPSIDPIANCILKKSGWLWTDSGYTYPEKKPDGSDWPRISIVTPSLNQEKYLEATICSVLAQGYPNLEYIIIDGGSSDGSVEIIKKYQERLHYWCSESDDGQYAAINKGFNKATGEIFAWINSDDLYCPWALWTIAQTFTQIEHMQWLSTLSPLAWDEQGYCADVSHLSGFSKEAFLDGCYLPMWDKRIGWIQQESTFWRRGLWEKAGGLREEVKLAADFDLWARFYKYTELYGINAPLGGFRWHGNQRSIDIETYISEAEEILAELRESCGYRVNRKPVLKYVLSKIPIIHIYAAYHFKRKIEEYNGVQLVHAGREMPGQWIETDTKFSPEIIGRNAADYCG